MKGETWDIPMMFSRSFIDADFEALQWDDDVVENYDPDPDYSPEHRLLVDILKRAYWDLSLKPEKEAALEWTRYEGNEPWTFKWVVANLNLDLDIVRAIFKRRFNARQM